MIKEPLSREAAEQLFYKEAFCFFGRDAVPQYRIVELLGENAADFLNRNMKHNGYMTPGRDYNMAGEGTEKRPLICYVYMEGFIKIVSEYNYLCAVKNSKNVNAEKWVNGEICV